MAMMPYFERLSMLCQTVCSLQTLQERAAGHSATAAGGAPGAKAGGGATWASRMAGKVRRHSTALVGSGHSGLGLGMGMGIADVREEGSGPLQQVRAVGGR